MIVEQVKGVGVIRTLYIVKRKRKEINTRYFDESYFVFRKQWSANVYMKWRKYREPNEEFYVEQQFMMR